jgi:hypothetical protein
MGARGFQPRPDSKRGTVANGGVIPEPIQEDITPPVWCKSDRLKLFQKVVAENRAAGVAIRQVDADQYAELADAMIERRNETDGRTKLAWGRQIDELRSQLNIGPRNRQRAGIKDTRKPTAVNPTLAIIARAKQRGNMV